MSDQELLKNHFESGAEMLRRNMVGAEIWKTGEGVITNSNKEARELPHIWPGLPHIWPGLPHIWLGLPHIWLGLPHIWLGLPHIWMGLTPIWLGLPHIWLGLPHMWLGLLHCEFCFQNSSSIFTFRPFVRRPSSSSVTSNIFSTI